MAYSFNLILSTICRVNTYSSLWENHLRLMHILKLKLLKFLKLVTPQLFH